MLPSMEAHLIASLLLLGFQAARVLYSLHYLQPDQIQTMHMLLLMLNIMMDRFIKHQTNTLRNLINGPHHLALSTKPELAQP